MAVAVGHNAIVGFKKNSNPWGKRAVQCASGDGIEVESLGLTPAIELIRNAGLRGSPFRRDSVSGNVSVQGDVGPMPLYYRGLEVPLALALGTAGTPSNLSGTAYKHTLKPKADLAGLFASMAADKVVATHEWPSVKVAGFTIEAQQGQYAKLSLNVIGFDENLNIGAKSTNDVVAAVEPANGALTIAAQPTHPTPLAITVTDSDTSITELIATIKGLDKFGIARTETYTLSADGLTFTTVHYYRSVTDITLSGLAGSATGDTIEVGSNVGVNTAATMGSVSLPSDRDLALFAELECLINDHTAGALTAPTETDLQDAIVLSGFRLQMQHNMDSTYSTEFGNRVREPINAGQDFSAVTISLNVSEYDGRNVEQLKKLYGKTGQKIKLSLTGNQIASTGERFSYTIYLNNVRFADGGPGLPGPGIMPYDLNGEAEPVTAIPTGFPAGYTDPITVEIVSTLSTDPLA